MLDVVVVFEFLVSWCGVTFVWRLPYLNHQQQVNVICSCEAIQVYSRLMLEHFKGFDIALIVKT